MNMDVLQSLHIKLYKHKLYKVFKMNCQSKNSVMIFVESSSHICMQVRQKTCPLVSKICFRY